MSSLINKISEYQNQYNNYNDSQKPVSPGLVSRLAGEIRETLKSQENDQKSRAALQELLTKVNSLKQKLSSAIRPRAATSTPPITPSTAPSITSPVTPPTPTTGGDFSDLQRRMDALKTRVVVYADRRDKAGLQNHPIHSNLAEYARDRLVTMETSVKRRTNYGEVQELVMESERLLSAAEAHLNQVTASSQQRQRSSTSSTPPSGTPTTPPTTPPTRTMSVMQTAKTLILAQYAIEERLGMMETSTKQRTQQRQRSSTSSTPSSETPTTAPTTPPTPTTSTVQTARASIIQATKQPRMPNPSPEDQGAAFSYIMPGGQMPKLRPVARPPVAQPPVTLPTQAPLSAPPLQTAPAQPTLVRTERMNGGLVSMSRGRTEGSSETRDGYQIVNEIQTEYYSDGSTRDKIVFIISDIEFVYQAKSGGILNQTFPNREFDSMDACLQYYQACRTECEKKGKLMEKGSSGCSIS